MFVLLCPLLHFMWFSFFKDQLFSFGLACQRVVLGPRHIFFYLHLSCSVYRRCSLVGNMNDRAFLLTQQQSESWMEVKTYVSVCTESYREVG